MDQDRLHSLLHRHCDQVLTAVERAELEQMLLASPRAREVFWEATRWHAALRQWGEAEWGRLSADFRDEPVAVLPRWHQVTPGSRSRKALAYAALAVGLLILSGQQFLARRNAVPAAIAPPNRLGIAMLAGTADAVWTNPDDSRQAGQTLQPGWLRLASGAVQLEFARGARVVLEGPAEFHLISENNAELRSGRMRAHVPEPAKGFTITTPGMVVVDRGTEFACSVPLEGAPEVHVFSGEVDVNLARSGGVFQSLRGNQAVRVQNGQAHVIQPNPGAFLSEQALARRTAENIRVRVADWRKASSRFGAHRHALVHLDFEPEGTWQRFLDNRATNAPARSAASVIGCNWEYGRWPGKLALEFKRTDDRVRLSVPGGHESLTLLAWVRVDSLARKQHALLMSDSVQRGAIHWYLQQDGRLGLGIHTADDSGPNNWRHMVSTPAVRPELLGAWVMLATVVDGATGTVTHYRDGQFLGSSAAEFPKPLRPGTCELGNWMNPASSANWPALEPQSGSESPRNFHGRMDEFTLLATALDAAEIVRRFDAGRPGDSTTVSGELPLVKAF